ncbi:MAG: ABC transporter permease, partial [Thermoanaerobaculia bacterium]|nr:ABC transporter permease [Thermoanaerobaculia bacterium]
MKSIWIAGLRERLVDTLARDTRHALRRLAHDWRFSLPAMLVLALGIGANTAMFSVVNRALFTALPLVGSDRLVNLYQNIGDSNQPFGSSYPVYQDVDAHTDLFSGVAAFTFPLPVRYEAEATLRSGMVEYASANLLEVQGLRLPIGRWFSAQEDRQGGTAVAVVSHRAWTLRFGADP